MLQGGGAISYEKYFKNKLSEGGGGIPKFQNSKKFPIRGLLRYICPLMKAVSKNNIKKVITCVPNVMWTTFFWTGCEVM